RTSGYFVVLFKCILRFWRGGSIISRKKMKTGLETIKLGLTNSVITVPEGRFYVINSLYLSNIDVVDRSASVYIKRPDSLDSYYLVKEAVISVQLALQVISNAVFL